MTSCVITLGLAGLLVIPGLAQSVPAFEVASVRIVPLGMVGLTYISDPGTGTFTARNVRLDMLIQMAFGVEESQILGRPAWLGVDRYNITAKLEGGKGLTFGQLKAPLQQLLTQRFGLAIHREMRDIQGYAMVVTKSGAKLQKLPVTDGTSDQGYLLPGGVRGKQVSVEWLAAMLALKIGRPIVDKTDIKGDYEITLDFAPDSILSPADSSLPSIFTALQEQLGLKLESQKVPVEMLVIDHVERVPTEN